MLNIRVYIEMNCYIYTFVIFVNALLIKIGVANEMSLAQGVELFFITTMMTGMLYVVNNLLDRKENVRTSVEIIVHLIAIFIAQWLGYYYVLGIKNINWVPVIPITIMIYFMIRGILNIGYQKEADNINAKINKRRNKDKE